MSDLQELFSRDPLEYSEKDIDQIIEEFRARRKQFNLGNAKAGSAKLTAKQKEAAELGAKLNLKLEL
jgi:hypothetical protein